MCLDHLGFMHVGMNISKKVQNSDGCYDDCPGVNQCVLLKYKLYILSNLKMSLCMDAYDWL